MALSVYILIGFNNYEIRDKILYRKPIKIKDTRVKFRYLSEKEIKICEKDGAKGYFLRKNGKTKFYPLKKLKHRLKKMSDLIYFFIVLIAYALHYFLIFFSIWISCKLFKMFYKEIFLTIIIYFLI